MGLVTKILTPIQYLFSFLVVSLQETSLLHELKRITRIEKDDPNSTSNYCYLLNFLFAGKRYYWARKEWDVLPGAEEHLKHV